MLWCQSRSQRTQKQCPLMSFKALWWFVNKSLKEAVEVVSKHSRWKEVQDEKGEHTKVEDMEEGGNLSQRPQWSVLSITIQDIFNMNVPNGTKSQITYNWKKKKKKKSSFLWLLQKKMKQKKIMHGSWTQDVLIIYAETKVCSQTWQKNISTLLSVEITLEQLQLENIVLDWCLMELLFLFEMYIMFLSLKKICLVWDNCKKKVLPFS